MIKNIIKTRNVFTQTWPIATEVIEYMEKIRTAIEELRSDILKEIPEVKDYSTDIVELQLNYMNTWKRLQDLEDEIGKMAIDINNIFEDMNKPVEPVKEIQPEVKYYVKTIYSHNRFVVGAIGVALVLSTLGIIF